MSSLFTTNERGVDRALRLVVGLVLLSLVFVGPHTKWGYLGIVLILTALTGNCPIYSIFGISTCPVRTTRTAH